MLSTGFQENTSNAKAPVYPTRKLFTANQWSTSQGQVCVRIHLAIPAKS